MTSSPAPDLDELRKLAEAATPGPWKDSGGLIHAASITPGYEHARTVVTTFETDVEGTADAAYIAAASPDVILALLAELRAAREATVESGRLREALADVRRGIASLENPGEVDSGWRWGFESAVIRVLALLPDPPKP